MIQNFNVQLMVDDFSSKEEMEKFLESFGQFQELSLREKDAAFRKLFEEIGYEGSIDRFNEEGSQARYFKFVSMDEKNLQMIFEYNRQIPISFYQDDDYTLKMLDIITLEDVLFDFSEMTMLPMFDSFHLPRVWKKIAYEHPSTLLPKFMREYNYELRKVALG